MYIVASKNEMFRISTELLHPIYLYKNRNLEI